MIPLYGFLEGDTLGLLVLAEPTETLGALARRLEESASTRVAPRGSLHVLVDGRLQRPDLTIADVGLGPLDRFDVRLDGLAEEER
jgi:hypothetical protein